MSKYIDHLEGLESQDLDSFPSSFNFERQISEYAEQDDYSELEHKYQSNCFYNNLPDGGHSQRLSYTEVSKNEQTPKPSVSFADEYEPSKLINLKERFSLHGSYSGNRNAEGENKENRCNQMQNLGTFPVLAGPICSDFGYQFSFKRKPAIAKLKYVIGKVDHAVRWYKQLKNNDIMVLYSVFGVLEYTRTKFCEQLLFLKGDSGQILQCVFYNIDRDLPSFSSGSIISVTGKMTGGNKMQIYDAELSNIEEMEEAIPRLVFVSQRTLNEMLKK